MDPAFQYHNFNLMILELSEPFYHKQIRLRKFDYSSSNSYFLTICVKNFKCLLGEVRNGIVGLSDIGNTAAVFLQKIPELRPTVFLDEFLIMPNHLHCILTIQNLVKKETTFNKFGKPVTGSVSVIINQYKGAVKKWCNQNGFGNFEWHEKFYDRILRGNIEFENAVNYIRTNPVRWKGYEI